MKIYVGMGLTQAPEEFRVDFQDELKAGLGNISEVEVLDTIELAGKTDKEIYEYDRECAESADLCVFIVDHPSIDLGIEIAFRLAMDKLMIVFAKKDAKITRMLTGLCEVERFKFCRYSEVAEIVLIVEVFIWAREQS